LATPFLVQILMGILFTYKIIPNHINKSYNEIGSLLGNFKPLSQPEHGNFNSCYD